MANMINSEVDELRSGIFVIFGSNTIVRACIMSVRLPVVDLNWTKFGSRHKRFIFKLITIAIFYACLWEKVLFTLKMKTTFRTKTKCLKRLQHYLHL